MLYNKCTSIVKHKIIRIMLSRIFKQNVFVDLLIYVNKEVTTGVLNDAGKGNIDHNIRNLIEKMPSRRSICYFYRTLTENFIQSKS